MYTSTSFQSYFFKIKNKKFKVISFLLKKLIQSYFFSFKKNKIQSYFFSLKKIEFKVISCFELVLIFWNFW
jgi:hypothetical protein